MKKAFGFALVAASLLLASGAQAQTLHVRADVPFDFVVGNNVYPAGNYDIARTLSISNALLITSDAKMTPRFVLPIECTSGKPAEKTVLVFHRIGDEYFLYQIWTEGSTVGRELPQPKRETELARNGKGDDVIIAANLIQK